MQRLRGYDLRISRLPGLLGLCANDIPAVFDVVNTAQSNLLYAKEAGDESWWGTWAEIGFNVTRATPYITLPREVARIEAINICTHPIPVFNQFAEYLQFGNGRMPKNRNSCPGSVEGAYSRNNVPTFVDLTSPPQFITIFVSSAQDVGKRILIQGLDQNNNTIYSQDTFQRVTGIYVGMDVPFAQTPMPFNRIVGIQKDVTAGAVHIFQTDPTTGAQILLLTMEPTETTASYRRYYLDNLPNGCCPGPNNVENGIVQVTAIAKLEPIPVVADTDYLVIQNKEAMIAECQSVRYSEFDDTENMAKQVFHHRRAIGMLNGELAHYLGKDDPAVGFYPFGSAKLENQRVGLVF